MQVSELRQAHRGARFSLLSPLSAIIRAKAVEWHVRVGWVHNPAQMDTNQVCSCRRFRLTASPFSCTGHSYKSVFRANCVVAPCSQSSCTSMYIPVAARGAPSTSSRKFEFIGVPYSFAKKSKQKKATPTIVPRTSPGQALALSCDGRGDNAALRAVYGCRSDVPVISTGTGNPIIANNVGAISRNAPPSRTRTASVPTYTSGTLSVVCCVWA